MCSSTLEHLQAVCTSCSRITNQAVISACIRMLCLGYGGSTRPQLWHSAHSTTLPTIHQAGIHTRCRVVQWRESLKIESWVKPLYMIKQQRTFAKVCLRRHGRICMIKQRGRQKLPTKCHYFCIKTDVNLDSTYGMLTLLAGGANEKQSTWQRSTHQVMVCGVGIIFRERDVDS